MDGFAGADSFILFLFLGVLPFLLLVAVVSVGTTGILKWIGGRGRPRP
ncbi:hypothetical protein SAMN06295885_0693 [Rathayibacter oskolensis]|uniref:Uncharacterized protein n=1 Tax=Rathayibacter oskolensis TaxID=1891671 RepID=A0A1X7N426_9MICO|nr:hypothetical protein SAMN06295885_0693 [Rathayibacter oskolensis]